MNVINLFLIEKCDDKFTGFYIGILYLYTFTQNKLNKRDNIQGMSEIQESGKIQNHKVLIFANTIINVRFNGHYVDF